MEEDFCLENCWLEIIKRSGYHNRLGSHVVPFWPIMHLGAISLVTSPSYTVLEFSSAKMGKVKESSDSKRKRKRVAVESSSDDDESEQDLEEVTENVLDLRVDEI